MPRRSEGRASASAAAIGKSIGRLAAKVDTFKRRREAVAAELLQAVEAARGMLKDLGTEIVPKSARRKTARRTKPRRKRTLTPEGRARIVAALKRRWAKSKRAKKRR
ncbi:MAG: hypothetical protein R2752_13560 [Vicinamibacterales bacterium]